MGENGGNGKIVRQILKDILSGSISDEKDALALLNASGRDTWEIAAAADLMREEKAGDDITWVKNQNINVTNICINSCGFCGFCRKKGDPDTYYFDEETLRRKVREAKARGVSEICTVSGLHPDFNAESYLSLLRLIREETPDIHIHAANPMEVWYGAKQSGISTKDMLIAMKEAGLGSMCGTAAEILVDDIRKKICPGKVSTGEWVRIIKEAHNLGIPTTATIMYGSIESPEDVVSHLKIIRDIQDETGGFTEFVPLSYIHGQTPLYRQGLSKPGATGRYDILISAVSRLYLNNFTNIQTSWVKFGTKFAQLCLIAGANDIGGTMFEESISKSAGATDTEYLDPEEMERMSRDLRRGLVRRTTLYQKID
ncbi:MAG: 5-amino-6-(D-ribitylamino)uracil--L-tyrosine 4-hydroxyphenyl transferase CofH [Methanomicrobiaceae archaeon]|nr:5-amino-6-(D-ribitylamino)uracil--L-tyrosine 4-hydroxyphenyl transferase CofH [Methanomicrobiaceae archaeon]